MNKSRMMASGAGLALLVFAALWIPLPHHVVCPVQVQPRGAAAVYIEQPGTLHAIHVRPGDQVAANQKLLTLQDIDSQLVMARLQAEKNQLESKLESVRKRALHDDRAVLDVGQIQQAIEARRRQLEQRRAQFARLEVTAPSEGVVISVPPAPRGVPRSGRLPTWSGGPLELRNIGAFLRDGVPICQIGDPDNLAAICAIDQNDIELVRAGQPVEIVLEQFPGQRFRGAIQHISKANMETVPASLFPRGGGELATKTAADGRQTPASTTYQASVPLDGGGRPMTIGGSGRAKIRVGRQSVGRRLMRWVRRTFYFEM